MEITSISPNALKVRGKQSTFAINPFDINTKIAAASAIFFARIKNTLPTKNFEEAPVVIQGPGDYEVGGIKIVGSRVGESFIYRITVDGVVLLAAQTSALVKAKDSVSDYDMLVLEADAMADQSVITSLNAKVIILYGEKKRENAQALGQEVSPVSKFSITREKLPAETQMIVLQ